MYVQNGYSADPAWGMGPFISPVHLFSRSEVYSEPPPETAIVWCTDGENTVSFFQAVYKAQAGNHLCNLTKSKVKNILSTMLKVQMKML